VLCDEHGTGGDGDYCGDIDAQLGHTIFFLPRGLGRQVRTTPCVLRRVQRPNFSLNRFYKFGIDKGF
jgi:hypothetical protein